MFQNCSINHMFKLTVYKKRTLTTCPIFIIFFLLILEEHSLPQIFDFNYKAMSREKSHYWFYHSSPQFSALYFMQKSFVHWLSRLDRSFNKVYSSCNIAILWPTNVSINKQSTRSILYQFYIFMTNNPTQCRHNCRALFLWHLDHFKISRNLSFKLLIRYTSYLPAILNVRLLPLSDYQKMTLQRFLFPQGRFFPSKTSSTCGIFFSEE